MKKKFFLIIALCIMQIFVYSGCDKAAEMEPSASSLSNNKAVSTKGSPYELENPGGREVEDNGGGGQGSMNWELGLHVSNNYGYYVESSYSSCDVRIAWNHTLDANGNIIDINNVTFESKDIDEFGLTVTYVMTSHYYTSTSINISYRVDVVTMNPMTQEPIYNSYIYCISLTDLSVY
jgi:hypothetical protein